MQAADHILTFSQKHMRKLIVKQSLQGVLSLSALGDHWCWLKFLCERSAMEDNTFFSSRKICVGFLEVC